MTEFELPMLIILIANPYGGERTIEAVAVVKAKTKRQARSIAASYPFFKEFTA